MQCETEHLVAISTTTAHATTILRITDFTMKLQRVVKALYTSGLMPRVFFAFAHVCHTGVPFKLWVICTV